MRKKAAALAIIAVALTGCQGIEAPQTPDLTGIPSITLPPPDTDADAPTVTASPKDVAPSSPQGAGERVAATPDQGLIDRARKALPGIPVVSDDYPRVDGYERGCGKGEGCVFGQSWSDDNTIPGTGHNGCDTRNDVIAATVDSIEFKDGGSCAVASGTYEEPYFGTIETFVRGEDTNEQDEIDHVIPLRLAWDLGASEWPMDKRVNFANDTEVNLVLTTRAANSGGLDLDGDTYKDRQDLGEYEGKSDMGASEWLEWLTDDVRACNFAARFVLTADRYDLPLTESDARDIAAAFERCD